ncbi:hypothetical protein [Bradyrhizobium sp. 2]|uniref:hypothetical protein n=1 Tax=Bradyrhizobium sp. 2 TaxID=190045 RepID=UPI001FF99A18|nr:hypothetical protein [Bradyrhizobium sp. 2]
MAQNKTGHVSFQTRPMSPETGQRQNLSPDSYQDLSDYLALFLRKAKRNADVSRLVEEVTGRDKKGVFE